MRCLLVLCVVAGVLAEPPRFRPARFRFQRQELAPSTTESAPESTTDAAPYPPSGWKPTGEPFTLPDQTEAPAETYGPPSGPYPPSGWKPDQPFNLPNEPVSSYGAPDNSYGPPESTETPTTENPDAEKFEGPVDVQKSVGSYYVLLPNGQLQRVDFATENDVQNMKYLAQLQYSNRSPAPIYVVGP